MRTSTMLAGLLGLLVATAAPLAAQEWTRFHGPNGTGISETNFPARFTENDFVFRTRLPGIGHSSPVVWGDKLFVLSADMDTATRYVVCLNADTGETLWVREYPSRPHALHDRSSYASSTPTVDAERVYAAWAEPNEITLLALKHDGTDAWRLNLGRYQSQHGFGTSPILFENLVILFSSQDAKMLNPGEQAGDTYVMAFDRETGDEVWRSPRKSTVVTYSVPCIYEGPRGPELVCCHSEEGIFSLDPRTGKENWSSNNLFSQRTVSSPVLAGDLILGSNGSGGGRNNYLVAIRPGKKVEVAYEVRRQAPYVPTSVTRGDLLFTIADIGVASCLDAATGKPYWTERIDGTYSGSPIRAGDKIFAITDNGELASFAADKSFEYFGLSPLGEPSRATPAVANGKMYLRTYSHVICVSASDK